MEVAGIGKNTLYKLKNGENVTTNTLFKICEALHCDISDIVEYEKYSSKSKSKFFR